MFHFNLRSVMPRRVESALADDYALTTRDIRYVDYDIERFNRLLINVKADMAEVARVLQVFQDLQQTREVESGIAFQEQNYDQLINKALLYAERIRSLKRRRKVLFDSLGY